MGIRPPHRAGGGMIRFVSPDPAVTVEVPEAATAPRLTLTVVQPPPAPGMVRSLDPALTAKATPAGWASAHRIARGVIRSPHPALTAEAPVAGAVPLAGLRAPDLGPGPARGRWASAHPTRGMA